MSNKILSTTEVITTQVIADVTADLPEDISIPIFLETDHLKVYECVSSVGETSHSVSTLLVESTNYTVAQAEDGTGTLTVTSVNAVSGSVTIVVINDPDIERTADFSANNYLDIEALEEQIDQISLKLKQMEALLLRTIRFDIAGIQAGIDDVAPLGQLPALVTDQETDDYFLKYDKTQGKFIFVTADDISALMTP